MTDQALAERATPALSDDDCRELLGLDESAYGAGQGGGGGQPAAPQLFSKEQRAFFATHAPEGLELDDLSILGQISVLKLRLSPKGFDRKLVAELWFYPDFSRILELSTKSAPAEAFQAAADARAFLAERGVDLTGEHETKTRKALEFFSERLKAQS